MEFASVVDAVRCAVEVQREMAIRNGNIPTERRIEFRMGINLGDIIVEDGDIFGSVKGPSQGHGATGETRRKRTTTASSNRLQISSQ